MQQSDKTKIEDTNARPLAEPDSAHERNNVTPDSEDLSDPAEVWKDGETTPTSQPRRTTGGDRVADPGDLGGGTPSPYSEETQADALARQTKRPVSGK